MDFAALFQHQQRLLKLELAIARERFAHYGLRGDAVEMSVRDFLDRHLPRALSTGTGEVIASQSDTPDLKSGQVDVVISNMLQPFIGARDVPTTFLLEGVHTAGEVKTTFSRADVTREMQKARKFRSLRARNVSRLVSAPKPDSWISYYIFYRPYFLLSLETNGDWRSILMEIMMFIKETRTMPLDGVFLLDVGIVILLSPIGKYPFVEHHGIPFPHMIQAKSESGAIHIYETNAILALFLFWIASFQVNFFDDQHPISFYISDMINKSLSDISLFAASEPQDVLGARIEKLGLFEVIMQELKGSYT